MTIWRVGMKAVCVDDSKWGPSRNHPILPVKGGVYTIDAVWFDDVMCGLGLVECSTTYPYCFQAEFFRPVTEQRSENKHFAFLRDLLTNPHKVLEEA